MAAHVLYGQDNDSYAFRAYPSLTKNQQVHQSIVPDLSGAVHPGLRRCEGCGELLAKWDEPLSRLIVKKRKYDISCTYDGVTVVSERFESVCDASGLTGLSFQKLPDDPEFYAIQASETVAFDAERRKTRFLKQCDRCRHYDSVTGATPVFLKEGQHVPSRGFVRTDLEFGSGDEKHPLLLCGEDAASILKTSGLKGIDLTPIR